MKPLRMKYIYIVQSKEWTKNLWFAEMCKCMHRLFSIIAKIMQNKRTIFEMK